MPNNEAICIEHELNNAGGIGIRIGIGPYPAQAHDAANRQEKPPHYQRCAVENAMSESELLTTEEMARADRLAIAAGTHRRGPDGGRRPRRGSCGGRPRRRPGDRSGDHRGRLRARQQRRRRLCGGPPAARGGPSRACGPPGPPRRSQGRCGGDGGALGRRRRRHRGAVGGDPGRDSGRDSHRRRRDRRCAVRRGPVPAHSRAWRPRW